MVGVLTKLAYANSVSLSCVYFITCSRLGKQTSPEPERNNQNQKPVAFTIQEKSIVMSYRLQGVDCASLMLI